MFTSLTDSVLSIIFPKTCTVCDGDVERQADGPACDRCWQETRVFAGTESLCEKCGVLLGARGGSASVACGECRDHFYDGAFAVGVYEKALAASVVSLKTEPQIPKRLIDVMRSAFECRFNGAFSIVIPVPLSKKRLHERGHNQASVIADAIGEILGGNVDRGAIARNSHTQMHRGLMDRKAREASVKNAFTVVKPRLVKGEKILLVDDVLTTGATVSACAKALKDAGAESVTVFTLARAIRHF